MSKNSSGAFIKWTNVVLSKSRKPETTISDLDTAFLDGTVLALMAEVLTGEALKITFNPKRGAPLMSNFEVAFKVLEKTGPLVNIHPSSLADAEKSGRVSLGLIWQLICKYTLAGIADNGEKVNMNEVKSQLIKWINERLATLRPEDVKALIAAYPGASENPNYDSENGTMIINDFEKSWKDGCVVAALVSACSDRPRGAMSQFTNNNENDSVKLADSAIERALADYDIPKLVDGDEMVNSPDTQAILTYASYFPKIEPRTVVEEDAEAEAARRAAEEEAARRAAEEEAARRAAEEEAIRNRFDEVAFLETENGARVLTEGRREKLEEQLEKISNEIAACNEEDDLSENPNEMSRRQRLQKHKARVENSLRRGADAEKAKAEQDAANAALAEELEKAKKEAAEANERADKAEKDAAEANERADKAEKDAAATQAALDEANDELARLRKIVAGVRELLG